MRNTEDSRSFFGEAVLLSFRALAQNYTSTKQDYVKKSHVVDRQFNSFAFFLIFILASFNKNRNYASVFIDLHELLLTHNFLHISRSIKSKTIQMYESEQLNPFLDSGRHFTPQLQLTVRLLESIREHPSIVSVPSGPRHYRKTEQASSTSQPRKNG